MQKDFEILGIIRYSKEKDDADVVLRYNGESFDPEQKQGNKVDVQI